MSWIMLCLNIIIIPNVVYGSWYDSDLAHNTVELPYT